MVNTYYPLALQSNCTVIEQSSDKIRTQSSTFSIHSLTTILLKIQRFSILIVRILYFLSIIEKVIKRFIYSEALGKNLNELKIGNRTYKITKKNCKVIVYRGRYIFSEKNSIILKGL